MKHLIPVLIGIFVGTPLGFLVEGSLNRSTLESMRSRHEDEISSYSNLVDASTASAKITEDNLTKCRDTFTDTVNVLNETTATVNMFIDILYDLPAKDLLELRRTVKKPPYLSTIDVPLADKAVKGVLEGLQ